MTRPDILFFKQCGYSSTELPEIAVKFLMHAVYVCAYRVITMCAHTE